MRRLVAALFAAASLAGPAGALRADDTPRGTVVFVCEHGTVKSVIAMAWFNRLAIERGLAARAISRGVAPDEAVPTVISDGLARDGILLDGFSPAKLATGDLSRAIRLVAIGVDTSSIGGHQDVPVEHWDDVPPATLDYPAARDAIRRHIEQMITESPWPATPR